MSLDKSLSLVSATKPTLVDRKLSRRSRMSSRIQTQIEILEKIKSGETITREQRRLPKWWWMENGTYFLSIFYTRKPIELAKGKWSIHCKNIDAIIEALRTVSKSINEGEFDGTMEGMAVKVRQNFKKSA
jgi:hypothetical protein